MRAVAHFFSEDICWINLARDMLNVDGPILNPFPNGVFTKFNVSGGFRRHIIQPLDACFVVIVNEGRSVYVQDDVHLIHFKISFESQ